MQDFITIHFLSLYIITLFLKICNRFVQLSHKKFFVNMQLLHIIIARYAKTAYRSQNFWGTASRFVIELIELNCATEVSVPEAFSLTGGTVYVLPEGIEILCDAGKLSLGNTVTELLLLDQRHDLGEGHFLT